VAKENTLEIAIPAITLINVLQRTTYRTLKHATNPSYPKRLFIFADIGRKGSLRMMSTIISKMLTMHGKPAHISTVGLEGSQNSTE